MSNQVGSLNSAPTRTLRWLQEKSVQCLNIRIYNTSLPPAATVKSENVDKKTNMTKIKTETQNGGSEVELFHIHNFATFFS